MSSPRYLALSLLVFGLAACESRAADAGDGSPAPRVSELAGACAPDDGGITLPDGFCAIVFAEETGRARHLVVADNGDVFVAIRDARDRPGGVVALRDTDGDGDADRRERWGEVGGNDVLLDDGWLYFAPDDGVLRYPIETGSLVPSGPPDTVVSGLPADRSHTAKSIAIGPEGELYVNIGSPSNACQREARTEGSPGMDPCPELETRAGIWRFDAGRLGQTQADGERFATGLRNTVALRAHPATGVLYGAVHGRDQLHQLWPALFTAEQSAELPAEELVRIDEGSDFGWPYCYYDQIRERKVLAPEYGGDGTEAGRCADAAEPLLGFPGHWAPNDLEFYRAEQFPPLYRGGAFIAFHGSWNRAPLPQEGYKVVFVPLADGRPAGERQVFADGFRGSEDQGPRDASYRPVGLAVGPDGSLFISDSNVGRIWRVVYRGEGG